MGLRPTDQVIARRILQYLYEKTVEQPSTWFDLNNIHEILDLPENEVAYVIDRIDGDYITSGSSGYLHRITAGGIEFLHELGVDTILDQELRFEILANLAEMRREHGKHAQTNAEGLAKAIGQDEKDVIMALFYLEGKGQVKLDRYHGASSSVRIKSRGIDVGEFYADHGHPPDSSQGANRFQKTVGPNEQAKAQRIFRDQVELARSKVIIVDKFTKESTFDLLKHIPKGVPVEILTSDQYVNAAYKARVATEMAARPNLKVAYVKGKDWPYHGRFLVIDGEQAYSWDSSFHDIGLKQHVITEMAPTNAQALEAQHAIRMQNAKPIP